MLKPTCSAFVGLIAAILVTAPAWSRDVITISPAIAAGEQGNLPRLSVWEGSGLNISFSGIGETINKVWLDDPSRITLDFDTSLKSGQAQSIHLKRINPLDFENLPKTSSTLLTVVTNKNRYQFILTYGTGQPQYYAVNIAVPTNNRTTALNLEWGQQIRRGLSKARNQGLIAPEQGNMVLVERVHRVLALVAAGKSVESASLLAGVSMPFIQRLEQMGLETTQPRALNSPSNNHVELDPIDLRFLENLSIDNNN